NHAHHCLSRAVASTEENFQAVVEAGGIAHALFQQPKFWPKAETLQQLRLTGTKPASIAADRVDFTVVGDEPKRLCQRPTGLCVGRIPLMKNRKAAFKFWIGQVRIESRKLIRGEESLIDHRS